MSAAASAAERAGADSPPSQQVQDDDFLSGRWRKYPTLNKEGGGENLSLGLRVDCSKDFGRNRGANQNCLSINGLRIQQYHRASPSLWATVRLDPFGVPAAQYERRPRTTEVPTLGDSALEMVDDFAVVWAPRAGLHVNLELFEGAAWVPLQSGLATSGLLFEDGWKQTAISIEYFLPVLAGMRTKFTSGNGEGETTENLDPQQYLGFEVEVRPMLGISTNLGISFDENSIGSESHGWLEKRYAIDCSITTPRSERGYSTKRMAAGLALDGKLPAAPGLKAGLAWQKTVHRDLDNVATSAPGLLDLGKCPRLEPENVFVETESEGPANGVEKRSVGTSLAYHFADVFYVGAGLESRRLSTGSVSLITPCDKYAENKCAVAGNPQNRLDQRLMNFGGGVLLGEKMVFSLEYMKVSYGSLYTQFNYPSGMGYGNVWEMFNARIAYNWD
jgi:hypothetical protein